MDDDVRRKIIDLQAENIAIKHVLETLAFNFLQACAAEPRSKADEIAKANLLEAEKVIEERQREGRVSVGEHLIHQAALHYEERLWAGLLAKFAPPSPTSRDIPPQPR